MLLILTNKEDLTADYLIVRLLERELPYFRLNSEDSPQATFLVMCGAHEPRLRLTLDNKELDFGQVTGAWYRRSVFIPPPQQVQEQYQHFASGEIRHLLEGMLPPSNIRWVNPIANTHVAERKVYQLRIASDVGLEIPETIVSNDPDALRNFTRRFPDVVCKPIYQGLVHSSEGYEVAYTQAISPPDLADRQQLMACPTLLQVRIEKGVDIRLTIIGSDVYCAEIHTAKDAPIDWRATHGHVRYNPIEPPQDVLSLAGQLMSRLGLVYGALDFIRTNDGTWYFLEVNPAGEWAWLEDMLGFAMRDSFIKLFYGPINE